MDNVNQIVAPHLNAEVYRTDTTGNCNVSYLDYIRVQSDGSVLLGNSELTGRYWDGGASIFKDIAEAKSSQAYDKRSINLTSGTADGCFVDSYQKVLLCEDNGAISLWSTPEEQQAWMLWKEDKSVAEHDAAVLAVDCLDPGKEYVTVGGDGNAKVWDLNDMICIRHYKAHTMPTTGLSVKPKSNTVFVTASYDQHITLWDENISKSALDLVKNDCGVRCVQWLDDNRLVFGDDAGILRLLDTRNHEVLTTLAEFPAAVHKLAVNNENNRVGVICDNSIVSVCDVTEEAACKVVYHDRHMHTNFVRGLAWCPRQHNILYTCGWDSVIKSHSVV